MHNQPHLCVIHFAPSNSTSKACSLQLTNTLILLSHPSLTVPLPPDPPVLPLPQHQDLALTSPRLLLTHQPVTALTVPITVQMACSQGTSDLTKAGHTSILELPARKGRKLRLLPPPAPQDTPQGPPTSESSFVSFLAPLPPTWECCPGVSLSRLPSLSPPSFTGHGWAAFS